MHRRVGTTSIMAITLVACAFAAACGGADGTAAEQASTTAGQPGATATTVLGDGDGTFSMRTETFVDDSRPTADTPGRSIPTDIYLPGGKGPFPLIMHAHGMDGSSAKFSQLLSSWAEAGYVVVAPNFPRTNGDTPPELRSVGDYVNQPADVSFVLDRVLAENEPGAEMAGEIATDHMGISGLSLGGATTYATLFHPCCRDDRYVSGILMSAVRLPFEGGDYDYSHGFPILVFAGTADTSVAYDLQQSYIADLPGPTWDVTLLGGMHSPPFENSPSPQDEVVTETTLDFWALTLRGDEASADRLVKNATVADLSSVEYRP